MTQAAKAGRILGSLKDALNAASRDDTQRKAAAGADAANVTRAETAVVNEPGCRSGRPDAQGRAGDTCRRRIERDGSRA